MATVELQTVESTNHEISCEISAVPSTPVIVFEPQNVHPNLTDAETDPLTTITIHHAPVTTIVANSELTAGIQQGDGQHQPEVTVETQPEVTTISVPEQYISKIVVLEDGAYINHAFEDVDLEIPPNDVKAPIDGHHIRYVPTIRQVTPQGACCLRHLAHTHQAIEEFFQKYVSQIKIGVGLLVLTGYAIYFGYAMWYSLADEDQVRLLWMTLLALVLGLISISRRTVGTSVYQNVLLPMKHFVDKHFCIFKWGLILAFAAFVVTFLVVEVILKQPRNLVSLSGYAVFVSGLFIFSSNRSKVQWRPVVWGLGIQFIFALITLRTPWGFAVFQWLGARVTEFLAHTDEGSKFIFGNNFEEHRFAFKVLPVVVFFSAVISMLYYLGVMQLVILKLAWVMYNVLGTTAGESVNAAGNIFIGQVLPVVVFFSAVISMLYYLGVMQLVILKLAWVMYNVLGTTAGESVNAAGNIFIGQTEVPLLIRPLIDSMTPSELHAVMTGGYATIAGAVLASFVTIGVKANHLITASVMAAPCALALSKLSYPETTGKRSRSEDIQLDKPCQRNVIEAVSAGASSAVTLVANIAANLVAFIALLTFINATLRWAGERVGFTPPHYQPLTFQFLCSYALWPFAFLMGADFTNCRKVAELIGLKIFINEFVAYEELSKLIANRKLLEAYTGGWHWVQQNIVLDTGTTLDGGVLTLRSEVICTYALCGFANLSSIGMVMGALGSMSEKQRPVVARLAFRAMLVGTLVCFVNACTAGLLYEES